MGSWKLFFAILVVGVIYTIRDVNLSASYENQIGGLWELSVKASTLDQKADYLNRYLRAVDSAGVSGHDALLFPTINNAVDQNVGALQGLQRRLAEIRTMDPTSIQYQQAIAQITAQEQDADGNPTSVIEGAWFLHHHPLFWEWINLGMYLALGIGLLGAFAVAD